VASTGKLSETPSREEGGGAGSGGEALNRRDEPADVQRASEAQPAIPRAAPGGKGSPLGIVVGVLALAVLSLAVAAGLRGKRMMARAKAPGAARGVTDAEIVLGMAAPLYGPSRETGEGVKTGLELAFAAANEAGGVHGRKIRLVALDDGDEPDRSAKAVRELVEQHGVFAIVGDAGTAAAAAPIPYVNQKKVLYFGAVSGLPALHKDPPDRYVFNFRPGIAEEVRAAVRYLTEVRRIPIDKLAVFAQEDDFGEAGFAAVARLEQESGRDPARLLRVGYRRNTVDVDAAVTRLRAAAGDVRALVMIATAQPAARLIRRAKAAGMDLVYAHVSAVNPAELAEQLRESKTPVKDDVVVTEVVPPPESGDGAAVKYRQQLEKASTGEPASPVSLEGYVVGTLLVDALQRVGRGLDTEALVRALEGIEALDIGIGTPVGFSPRSHQASKQVWCAKLDGAYQYKPVE
jgi:branched-chain amino acid transport system substrate-binding protein